MKIKMSEYESLMKQAADKLAAAQAENARLRKALESAPDTFPPQAFDRILASLYLQADHTCFEKFIRNYWKWYDHIRAEALKQT